MLLNDIYGYPTRLGGHNIKNEGEIMEIEEIKKIPAQSLEPGDILVVKIPTPVSEQFARACREYVKKTVKADIEVMVLDGGMDIEILKKGEANGNS